MAAGAMFVGMLPMRRHPHRTCSTLLFVPFLYAVLLRGEVRPLKECL
jgi:hypothetical protein